MFLLNGLKFDPYPQRTIGDTQYPRGWFLDPLERAKIGVVEVADIPRPDPRMFDSTENPDGSWTSTPRDPAIIAAEDAEQARVASLDAAINSDSALNTVKAMTDAQIDAWFAANVTTAAQAITLLRRLTKVMLRKVL